MRIRIIVILMGIMIGLAGCSVQSKLKRNYKGKSQEELMLKMGKPTSVESLAGGREVYIYQKSKFLKAAAINTGQFQYDQFESPKVVKTEITRFYMNKNGVIEDVKNEVNYER